MASFQDIDSLLQCSVCKGRLKDPLTLPCQHNICFCCTNNTVFGFNVKCPTCKKEHVMPKNSFRGFNPNRTILGLLEMIEKKDKENDTKVKCIDCKEMCLITTPCPCCDYIICNDCVTEHQKKMKMKLEQILAECKEMITAFESETSQEKKRDMEEKFQTEVEGIKSKFNIIDELLDKKKATLIAKAKESSDLVSKKSDDTFRQLVTERKKDRDNLRTVLNLWANNNETDFELFRKYKDFEINEIHVPSADDVEFSVEFKYDSEEFELTLDNYWRIESKASFSAAHAALKKFNESQTLELQASNSETTETKSKRKRNRRKKKANDECELDHKLECDLEKVFEHPVPYSKPIARHRVMKTLPAVIQGVVSLKEVVYCLWDVKTPAGNIERCIFMDFLIEERPVMWIPLDQIPKEYPDQFEENTCRIATDGLQIFVCDSKGIIMLRTHDFVDGDGDPKPIVVQPLANKNNWSKKFRGLVYDKVAANEHYLVVCTLIVMEGGGGGNFHQLMVYKRNGINGFEEQKGTYYMTRKVNHLSISDEYFYAANEEGMIEIYTLEGGRESATAIGVVRFPDGPERSIYCIDTGSNVVEFAEFSSGVSNRIELRKYFEGRVKDVIKLPFKNVFLCGALLLQKKYMLVVYCDKSSSNKSSCDKTSGTLRFCYLNVSKWKLR